MTEYKPFKNKSDDYVLGVVLESYKKKLEGLNNEKLFKDTLFLPQTEHVVKQHVKYLDDILGYYANDNTYEIKNRGDVLYPCVCKAIRFYISELKRNESNLKELLGDSMPKFDFTSDLERLNQLSLIYCKTN